MMRGKQKIMYKISNLDSRKKIRRFLIPILWSSLKSILKKVLIFFSPQIKLLNIAVNDMRGKL